MPNGRSGGFLIFRRDLKAQLKTLTGTDVVGYSLALSNERPRTASRSDVSANMALQMLHEFKGERVWIEEQDHKGYIIHADFEVDGVREPDAARWIAVDSNSPLFDALRRRHKWPFFRFAAAIVARLKHLGR